MPTYEYRCPEGHEFEKFQRMSDPAAADCPECGQAAERILSGGAGLLFKGDGFYITDYRSDSYRKAAEKDKSGSGGSKSESGGGGSGGGGEGGGSKSEAKPSKPSSEKKKSGGSGGSGE